MKKAFWAAGGYGVLLSAFTGYVMLNTFVLTSPEQTAANEINYSLFAEETVQTAAEKSEDSDAPALSAIPIGTAKPASEQTTETQMQTDADIPDTEPAKESAIEESEEPAAETAEQPAETVQQTEPAVEYISNDTCYQDENIRITLNEYYEYDTAIYAADVQLSSAQYLKTAFAQDTYGSNITAATSEIASGKNALLAVNGDFYGSRGSGYVIRNGVLYRDTGSDGTDTLCITADGSFFITDSSEYSADELVSMGVWQAFSFGPALISDGSITVTAQTEVGRAMASNPRTAIGIIDDLHYVFVVADGRTSASEGLSLEQLAAFMQSLGVQTAYNLDGGGSSTMYFNGTVINNPTTSGRSIKERSVSDIVYIGY